MYKCFRFWIWLLTLFWYKCMLYGSLMFLFYFLNNRFSKIFSHNTNDVIAIITSVSRTTTINRLRPWKALARLSSKLFSWTWIFGTTDPGSSSIDLRVLPLGWKLPKLSRVRSGLLSDGSVPWTPGVVWMEAFLCWVLLLVLVLLFLAYHVSFPWRTVL